MKVILTWALARFEEPSTWAGIGGLIATMTFLPHAQDYAGQVTTVGGMVASALAVLLAEKKG